jgi:hypothetical protein
MPGSCRIPAAGLAAVLVLAAAGRADAQPYHNAEYKFGLEVPAGWRPMSAGELKRFNGEREPGRAAVKYLVGFRPTAGEWGGIPFVTVELDTEPAGMPFDEFEKQFMRDFNADVANPKKRGGVSMTFDPPAFDRERKRFTVRGWLGEGRTRAALRAAGHLSPDGLISVSGYVAEADLRRHESALTGLVDSLRFDGEEPPAPAAPAEPAAPPAASLPAWWTGLSDNGRMALVGGATVILVLVVGVLTLREKPDRRRQAW